MSGVEKNESEQWHEPKQEPPFRLDCLKMADAMFHCNSFRYQIKYYYQQGELDGCKDKWPDVKNCFRTKLKKPQEAKTMWEEYEASKAAKQAAPVPIWDMRTSPPENFPP